MIADKIAKRLPASDPLQAVLRQESRAYGTVAGAVDELAGQMARGKESDPEGRQAFAMLVAAIHAPRAEALGIAAELQRQIRGVTLWPEVAP